MSLSPEQRQSGFCFGVTPCALPLRLTVRKVKVVIESCRPDTQELEWCYPFVRPESDKRRLEMKRKMVPYTTVEITTLIVTVRGKRVILIRISQALYGTTTKRLNEQVKRNRNRFPEDFMFQLTAKEWGDLTSQTAMSKAQSNRSQFATGSQRHRDPRFAPYGFTEHGALMAANILRSERASR